MAKRSSKTKQAIATVEPIEPVIHVIRHLRVILDSDLARIYGVTTKALNQAIRRNPERFPEDFVFKLNLKETREVMGLRSQSVTSKKSRGAPLFTLRLHRTRRRHGCECAQQRTRCCDECLRCARFRETARGVSRYGRVGEEAGRSRTKVNRPTRHSRESNH